RARHPETRWKPPTCAALDPSAGGLVAQRLGRTAPTSSVLETWWQLGTRHRVCIAPASPHTAVCRDDYRHADDRARHVRGRVHGNAEAPHRPDALQGPRRSVLRVARLRFMVGFETCAGRR